MRRTDAARFSFLLGIPAVAGAGILEAKQSVAELGPGVLHLGVEALHAHHADRLAALESSCEQAPKSAAELLDVLFNRALDTHQTMFAMGEAIAHLNYLEQAGRLSRSIDAGGVIRFSRLQPGTAAN